ncbi:Sporulation related domain-containing protein [Oceanobacillus limi]|uniref:Sporulation related domain-containing protein n=1 Tax=Oceanobacillus limi TaxID=930131 RepID=A0A1I0GGH1_9BACI|nr:SPOR domain-containing protein [Oceanobacillus limi]SET70008.1 Sporulation related domain-containing protein [Oceanobacillus limi]
MENKKPIVVKIDDKKIEYQKKIRSEKRPDSNGYTTTTISREQQAAATDHSHEDEIQPFDRQYDNQLVHSSFKKKKLHSGRIKTFVFSGVSAIIIGSILGIALLNMFVNMDELTGTGNSSPVSTSSNNDSIDNTNSSQSDGEASGGSSQHTISAMNGYVLQGGVFSEEVNASNEATKFEELGYTPVIWEQDNQYYVLVGLTNTEQHAKSLAQSLKEEGLEVFSKPWSSEAIDLELTTEEYTWFQSLQQQWEEATTSLSQEDTLVLNDWQDIIDNSPQSSEMIGNFIESIEPFQQDLQDVGHKESQYILLSIWDELAHLAG